MVLQMGGRGPVMYLASGVQLQDASARTHHRW
jgi:hypothetical protein